MAKNVIPTVDQIEFDPLTQLAREYWSPNVPSAELQPFNVAVINEIYDNELIKSDFSSHRLMILEFSQILENFLWKNFDESHLDNAKYIMCMAFLINEKLREKIQVFDLLGTKEALFRKLFKKILEMALTSDQLLVKEQTCLLVFLDNCINNFEHGLLQPELRSLFNIQMWKCLSDKARVIIFKKYPKYEKLWKKMLRKETKKQADTSLEGGEIETRFFSTFWYKLIRKFEKLLNIAVTTNAEGRMVYKKDIILWCERMLELIIDTNSLLFCRKYVNVLYHNERLLTKLKLCQLVNLPQKYDYVKKRFLKLLDRFEFYVYFEINDEIGEPTTRDEQLSNHYDLFKRAQLGLYKAAPNVYKEFCFSPVAKIDELKSLRKVIAEIRDEHLIHLAELLGLSVDNEEIENDDKLLPLVRESVAEVLRRRDRQVDYLNRIPLFPTEEILYDEDFLEHFRGYHYQKQRVLSSPLTVPKLNLQFLTLDDYLQRNFSLFRVESAHGVRCDVDEALVKMKPARFRPDDDESLLSVGVCPNPELERLFLGGWHRMALPIVSFSIFEVGRPALGKTAPQSVRADICFAMPRRQDLRQEWECLRRHDVIFLCALQPTRFRDEIPTNTKRHKFVQLEDGRKEAVHMTAKDVGLRFVRGAEVECMLDADGSPIEDYHTNAPLGDLRTYRVHLDPNQYELDTRALSDNPQHTPKDDPYAAMNVVVRRDAKQNNFKAVLDTVRSLMNEEARLPSWLHDVFLGFGDPAAAHPDSLERAGTFARSIAADKHHLSNAVIDGDDEHEEIVRIPDSFKDVQPPGQQSENNKDNENDKNDFVEKSEGETTSASVDSAIDFFDTFVDWPHLISTFSGYEVTIARNRGDTKAISTRLLQCSIDENSQDQQLVEDALRFSPPAPPYRLGVDREKKSLLVVPYRPPHRAPFQKVDARLNQIRFTPKQIEAVHCGMRPGLTMIVGPPGSGKTDVAAQIVSLLRRHYPAQRVLLIAHSNMALNHLFEKISQLDVEGGELVRLGAGADDLSTAEDFSRTGRINFCLRQRLDLLRDADRLKRSILGLPMDILSADGSVKENQKIDPELSCETALLFFESTLQPMWDRFMRCVRPLLSDPTATPEAVRKLFPFDKYYDAVSERERYFDSSKTVHGHVEVAKTCWRHLRAMFNRLKRLRGFELIRTNADRAKLLMLHEAKVVAMTCTHAAMKRRDLVELGFKYDSIVMEEAAQVLDVESLLPIMLQKDDKDASGGSRSRLQRVVMIGDHHQLPPIIQNLRLEQSNFTQSLFARWISLGVPHIELDFQGRCRPSLANLFNWRYANLGNLPHVCQRPAFRLANPGMRYDFQFIDVGPFNGIGESEPAPHSYQNLAEAEMVVALYMYLRLLGYPRESIVITTTYNGQRQLINDVLRRRCVGDEMICRLLDMPEDVTTVDKFQGRQSEIVLLSLVRTRSVGHIRDIRRVVVALSRARLGLYVFGRHELYANCFEMSPAMHELTRGGRRPMKLRLVTTEIWAPAEERVAAALSGQADQPRMHVDEDDGVDRDDAVDGCIEIEDMPSMTHFANHLLKERLRQIEEYMGETVRLKVEDAMTEEVAGGDETTKEEEPKEVAETRREQEMAQESIGDADGGDGTQAKDECLIENQIDLDEDEEVAKKLKKLEKLRSAEEASSRPKRHVDEEDGAPAVVKKAKKKKQKKKKDVNVDADAEDND